jgi:hypothetical protein
MEAMNTAFDLAGDALFVRAYCVRMVRRINADLRRHGKVLGWIVEKQALLSILKLMRTRQNKRRNAAEKEAR